MEAKNYNSHETPNFEPSEVGAERLRFRGPKEAFDWYRAISHDEDMRGREDDLVAAAYSLLERSEDLPDGINLGDKRHPDFSPFDLEAVSILTELSHLNRDTEFSEPCRYHAIKLTRKVSTAENMPVNVRIEALKIESDLKFQELLDLHQAGELTDEEYYARRRDLTIAELKQFEKDEAILETIDPEDSIQLGKVLERFWILAARFTQNERRASQDHRDLFIHSAYTRQDRFLPRETKPENSPNPNFDVSYEIVEPDRFILARKVQLKARAFDPKVDIYEESIDPITAPVKIYQMLQSVKLMRACLIKERGDRVELSADDYQTVNGIRALVPTGSSGSFTT